MICQHPRPSFRTTSVAFLVLAFAFFSSRLNGDVLHLDNNGTTAGFGSAGGTWGTDSFWNDDDTGGAGGTFRSATTAGDDVFFGTDSVGLGTGTVTVSGTQSAGQLLFGKASGDVTLSGGTINMNRTTTAGGTATAQIRASSSGGSTTGVHTINSNISKTNGGSIRIGTQGTIGERYTINGVLSGNFRLDGRMRNNSAALTLNGLNTFTGNVNLVTGQYNVNTIANAGVASSLGAGSTIGMAGGGGQSPTLVYTGTTAASTDRAINMNGGGANRFVAQDASLTLTGALTGTDAGTTSNLVLSGDGGGTGNEISGVISGNTQIQVRSFTPLDGSSEAGVWTLSGNNSYTGSTTISDGSSLTISHDNALGSTAGDTTIEDGQLFISNGITTAENITIGATAPTGSITGTSGGGTFAGAITLEDDGADFRGSDVRFSGGINSVANQSLALNARRFVVDTNAIDLNNGTLTITSAANNVANATQLNVGGNDWGLARINFGGYLQLGGTDFMPTDVGVEFGWDLPNQSSATLDLNGFDQTVQFLSQSSNSFGEGGDINVTGGGTLTVNLASGTREYEGRITDGSTATSFVKDGAGTQVLRNLSGTATTYSGATSINAGRIQAGSTTSLSPNSAHTVAAGAVLELDGHSNSIGSLAGAGTVENASATAATLTMGGDNTSTQFSGVLQDGAGGGALSINKVGTGTQTLSGNNTYTGTTTVSEGTLVVNGNQSAATGDVTVASGATLTGTGTIGGATTISGTHAPGVNSVGTQTFASDLSYSASAVVNWELEANTIAGRGTSFDAIDVAGDLNFNGATTLNLDFLTGVDFGDAFWMSDQEWNLWSVTGTTSGFGSLSLGSISNDALAASADGTFSLFQDGSDVNLRFMSSSAAVPEPSSFAFLALALVGYGIRRRRQTAVKSGNA